MKKSSIIMVLLLLVAVMILIFGCGTEKVQQEKEQQETAHVEITPVQTTEQEPKIDQAILDVLAKADDITAIKYTKRIQYNDEKPEITMELAYHPTLGEKQRYDNREFHRLEDGKVYEYYSQYKGDTHVLVETDEKDVLKEVGILHELDDIQNAKIITKDKLIGTWEIMEINYTDTTGNYYEADIILAKGVPNKITKTDTRGNIIITTYDDLVFGVTKEDLKPQRGDWEIYGQEE